jgi:hypothetical protein
MTQYRVQLTNILSFKSSIQITTSQQQPTIVKFLSWCVCAGMLLIMVQQQRLNKGIQAIVCALLLTLFAHVNCNNPHVVMVVKLLDTPAALKMQKQGSTAKAAKTASANFVPERIPAPPQETTLPCISPRLTLAACNLTTP